MKRFILSTLFFVALVVAWHFIVEFKIHDKHNPWSPVIAVPPKDVGIYLWGALKDGTIWHASIITMRRFLILLGLLHNKNSPG